MLKRLGGSRLLIEENEMSSLYKTGENVKLNGSIQTIFELWAVLILLGCFGLSVEIAVQIQLSFKTEMLFGAAKLLLKALLKSFMKAIASFNGLLLFLCDALIQVSYCFRKIYNKQKLNQ